METTHADSPRDVTPNSFLTSELTTRLSCLLEESQEMRKLFHMK